MAEADFSAYVANRNVSQGIEKQWQAQKFFLEKKNGELVQHSLPLNYDAERLLSSLSKALESTGLAIMKPPPKPSSTDSLDERMKGLKNYHNPELNRMKFWSNEKNEGGTINNTFDVNTKRGRDLLNFITNVDMKEIEQRKADRIDASAAALVARQAYKFQSIDGTGLGWSSSSLAICLKTLTKVCDEHHSKFKVDTFYPFQLILSNDEFQKKIDLFGGKIILNPGSTQIQWLEILTSVTEDARKTLEMNRKKIDDNQQHVQNALNVQIRKGFSCSSEEYFNFMKDNAEVLLHESSNEGNQPGDNSVALNRVGLVVETHQACRRPVVTTDGEIRISASTPTNTIISSLSRLRNDAWENIMKEKEKKKNIRELESLLKSEFGVIKVKKNRLSNVTNDHYIHALSNILNFREKEQEMKEGLAGKSVGIIGGGHCRLGDDGSLMIPWNWH